MIYGNLCAMNQLLFNPQKNESKADFLLYNHDKEKRQPSKVTKRSNIDLNEFQIIL